MEKSEFKNLCEKIYKDWKEKPDAFCDFKAFQTEFMPETYYTVSEGKNTLYVLNNNPGIGLGCQTKEVICPIFETKSYSEIAKDFYGYISKDPGFNSAAKTRLKRMKCFADNLKFDGIEDVESFFLHSKSFNKKSFLNKIEKCSYVQEYTHALTEYLKDKPVLSINAVGTKKSISKDIFTKEWIKHVASIIGFDCNSAKEIVMTKKDSKITSAVFVSGKKIMLFTMGSNNIPTIDDKQKQFEEINEEIKKALL